ncbi:hypothetical protein [Vagococcus lutrae]|uniref:hypothetical protein n=1 Tax=Vagococcus lutrae TaxID=81947 RepID=UPI002096DB37|nr:hypothetical protein [Vagococcus lutrae]MCO7151939.1 hypothetical protein [Vagococcus lutrae]
MANEDIRKYAKQNNVYLYEVTKELGYKSANYSTIFFRFELDDVKKKEVMKLIDEIADNKKSLATAPTVSKAR